MQSERTYKKHTYAKGTVYGRLTLTGKNQMKSMYGQLRRLVEVDCECGIRKWVLFNRLVVGDTKSCGCLQRDVAREVNTTHGLSQHPLYDVYHAMLKRCFISTDDAYKDYGQRGISVCEEWQENFVTYYEWCIANGWKEGATIDRKNNDGHYGPNNCRIVGGHGDRKVQSRNNRRNKNITAFGETKCLFDWGVDPRCKVSVWALRSRLDRGKWTDMEAMITTPQEARIDTANKMKSNRMLTAFGEEKSLNSWLRDERCLVKVDSLRDRLDKGWDAEKAMSTPPKRDGKNGYVPARE
jgi:hypothetical protein